MSTNACYVPLLRSLFEGLLSSDAATQKQDHTNTHTEDLQPWREGLGVGPALRPWQ